MRQINEEKKLLEKKTVALEQLGVVRNEQVKHYKELYRDTKKEAKRRESQVFWKKTIYFIGGVLVTGALSYAALKYGRR